MNTRFSLIAPFVAGEVGKPVEVLRVGHWNFPEYGPVDISSSDIREFAQNWKNRVRRQDTPITREHLPQYGAAGWVKDVYASEDGNSLWAIPDYNDSGSKEVKDGAWRYISAELYRDWTDPENDSTYRNVLSGITLTNFPRIKDMAVISCAEPQLVPTDETVIPLPAFLVGYPELDALSEDELLALLLADEVKHTPQRVRDQLPTSAFAFVKQRKILIQKPGNVEAGIARFMQVQDVSEQERDTAWGRLKRAASRFGISAPASWRDIGHGSSPDKKQAASETGLLAAIRQELAERSGMNPQGQQQMADAFDAKSDTHGAMSTDGHTHGKFGKHSHSNDANHGDAPVKGGDQTMAESALVKQFTEMQAKQAALETTLSEQKKTIDAQAAQLAVERQTRILLQCGEAMEKAKREGRITPAQATTYLAELPKLDDAARDLWLKDIAGRPIVLPLGEKGSGAPNDTTTEDDDARTKLAERQKTLFAEAQKTGKPISMRDALLQANEELRQGARQ